MAGLWPLFASLPLWVGTRAQTTNATCIDSYAWAYNSYAQSPCMVAAYLQKQCASAPVDIPALHQNTLYDPPTAKQSGNSCQCSSVVYSLMSACASCQLGNYASWSAWSKNCKKVYLNVFLETVPAETDVPRWAYKLDLAKGVAFNVTAARLSVMGSPHSDAKANSVSPVLYGVVGAACAFVLVILVGGGIFLWRRHRGHRIGKMAPQKYSPLYETNPMGSLYGGNRVTSSEFNTYKGSSAPSTPPPIITEFRNSGRLAPAPSVRSVMSLPSLYSPGESHEYSPAMESSQGTAHGEPPKAVAFNEELIRSPARHSPVVSTPQVESSQGSVQGEPPKAVGSVEDLISSPVQQSVVTSTSRVESEPSLL